METLLHSWNPPVSTAVVDRVQLEDDSLRDGLQGAFTRRPSVPRRIELLEHAHRVGVSAVMIGFPASSPTELDDCRAMIAAIEDRELSLVPRFLARALVADLEPIAALHRESRRGVQADFFIAASAIRRSVEGWSLPDVLEKLERAAAFVASTATPFGVSIEDATRTPAEDLRVVVAAALRHGPRMLTICDTAGDATPEGAARIVSFVGELVRAAGADAQIWWHGHNDRGLALANAIAAAGAGAHTISGTFLGIGERTGNTPLEQVILYLHRHGATRFRLDALKAYCDKLAEYTETPIPPNTPIVGSQAFATCTGTHAAAILKARAIGVEHEDFVFSSVPASALGRAQDILIGPASGLASARYVLETLGLDASAERGRELLEYAKTKDGWLRPDEIATRFAPSAGGSE